MTFRGWPPEVIRGIQAPTRVIVADGDVVRPEHAVEMFRLLGGGIFGDTPAGLPNSQLAVLPGTSHVTLVSRADLLLAIIPPFLDAPLFASLYRPAAIKRIYSGTGVWAGQAHWQSTTLWK